MKHLLLLIVALLFLGVAPASAGEIDGKGVICDPTNNHPRQQVTLFKDGKAHNHSIGQTILSAIRKKPELGIDVYEYKYAIHPFKITWGDGPDKFELNRKSLVLRWANLRETPWTFQCRLSNEQEINRVMQRKVRRANQEMKKNKL